MSFAACVLLSLATPALAAPASAASGKVLDGRSGRPLGGVFVQQEGGLASAFTNPDGSFLLTLDREAAPRLVFTATGYARHVVEVGKGPLSVSLDPVDAVAPQSAPALPAFFDPEAALSAPPLSSAVQLAYRLRHQRQTIDKASISGFGNNDYRVGLRYRWQPLLLEADGAHYQVPVDVADLPLDQNPAMSPSTYEVGARVGWLWTLSDALELAPGLAYRYRSTVPNNKDIPYTGSDLDFEQSRHSLGPTVALGWRPPGSPWSMQGAFTGYPLVYAWADTPAKPFAAQLGLEGNLGAYYEIVPGLRLGLDYRVDNWRGNGEELGQVVAAQLLYTPSGLMRGR